MVRSSSKARSSRTPVNKRKKKEDTPRWCSLPFCRGLVLGNRNKKRCEEDRNIHLHQVISKPVKKIMAFIEKKKEFSAQDINEKLFRGHLDKNDKGSLYRLLQAMIRENYCKPMGKSKENIKLYKFNNSFRPRPKKPVGEDVREAKKLVKKTKASPKRTTSKKGIVSISEIRNVLAQFIYHHEGHYNHAQWLELLRHKVIKASKLSEPEIGSMLETEKAKFLSQI
ncbi:hypothetical protein ACFL35_21465 [Candidatus Riflebacteria bacterium]